MRRLMSVVAALLVLAAVAAPARADMTGLGVIKDGIVEVGQHFDAAPFGCDKQGLGFISSDSSGLYIPRGTANKTAVYSLVAGGAFPGSMVGVLGTPGPAVVEGQLHLCGYLKRVGGGTLAPNTHIGAACGMSKGYNGKGQLKWTELDGAVHWLNIQDLEWKFTISGTLPILGKYQQEFTNPDGSRGTKSDKYGQLIALAIVRGGSSCTQPQAPDKNNCTLMVDCGAQVFDVDAVFLLVNRGAKSNVVRWNDLPGFSKPGPLYKAKENQKPKGV